MLLTPVQARELRLLSRDRTFLVQSLVLPVLIIGAQFWLNSGGGFATSALGSPAGLAAIGFFMAAYALMFSAFQTLNTEGNALWILYSVPHPIEDILRQKALLWAVVCLVYPLAIFAFALITTASPLEVAGLAVVVLAGVPIFAVIATALGVFACDPLAQLVQRRLRPSYMYLYMLLAGLYVYAVFASSVWQRAGLMVLTALLGLALWQKARDHLPYLLDPSASPPARVSLSDGLVAAMLFFVLQALVTLIFVLNDQKVTGSVVLIAFSVAGAATFLLMRFVFWRLKSEGVPGTFGAGGLRALAWGAGGGGAAALAAFAYLQLARHTSLLEGARETVLFGRGDELWLAFLAVAAAPIFEEFIFRGLIFGGLRRTLGLAASVLASAAIFALVHPPFSVIPVFGLGVAAALVYEHTRLLIGPIAVHAVYNAAVVGLHFLPGWVAPT
jgi:membrane protease YdiL (CAAX protease family)